ncbi:NAD(P)H-dependent oxidoreductase [Paraburkholderia edwinii]|jgi:NAD(P)H-dependent FMN reductase|uniref:NAD(P)H-dependent oxidoreductase n=1 Tax=Paraburkholderia edwinii TaxID=2861782 RepID=A0ABX8UEK7_9BURK|nr:NADPH-dependent FMN reductase [Paraburkholderia edwinii]QYD67185.1 NAD(P)H-dependent oxidoreductase [Paraburkholderia edwinii]
MSPSERHCPDRSKSTHALAIRWVFPSPLLDAIVTRISVIVGSVRPGRFAEKPANWIADHLRQHSAIDTRILDLIDFPLPMYEEPLPPAYPGRPPFTNEVVIRWTAEIAASDGFVIVTPEYNHGYPPVLKNALDYVYGEWHRKPVAFISYGEVAGARSVTHLRDVVGTLGMASIRHAVQLPFATLMTHYRGEDVAAALAEFDDVGSAMVGELLWWTAALKEARDKG